MAQDRVEASHFSKDVQEFICLLHEHGVRYVIAGGEAVIHYGHARLTGDVDFFYDRQSDNAKRLFQALREFWDGDVPTVSEAEELTEPGVILQFGRPPNRIDLLNNLDGIAFDEVWAGKQEVLLAFESDTTPFSYIGLEQLMANKQAAARPKDEEDLAYLRRISQLDFD